MAVSVRSRSPLRSANVPVSPNMSAVDVIRVPGGPRLAGEVTVGGAKNSALELMAVALLAPVRTVIENVPRITDVLIMAEVLRRLGCDVTFGGAIAEHGTAPGIGHSGEVTIDVPEQPGHEADYDLVRRLRASIC